jgi:hypothetical protein
MVVCLGLYSIGAGAVRPEDRKKAPAAEPAKKVQAAPNAPAGFPNPLNPGNAVPGVPNGFQPPAPLRMPPRIVLGPPAGGPAGGPPMGPPQPFPVPAGRERAELPKDLVPTLIEALKDQDKDIRKYVASALVRIGKEAVEPLIDLLKAKDKAQRANAAYILGQIGADAQEALPLLVKALKDDDRDVRLRAAFAVERLLASGRNNMRMAGMPMAFNPMTGMMGGREAKPSVTLPADPGPVAPTVDVRVKEPEKKGDKGTDQKPEKKPEKKADEKKE